MPDHARLSRKDGIIIHHEAVVKSFGMVVAKEMVIILNHTRNVIKYVQVRSQ